jgi:subtilase family protein
MRITRQPAAAQSVSGTNAAQPASAAAKPEASQAAGIFQDRTVASARPAETPRTADSALGTLVDLKARRASLRAAGSESPQDGAAQTAEELRHSPDAQKLGLLDRLEALGNSSPAGWDAVYNQAGVVENLAAAVKETYDPAFEQRAAAFLCKVYKDHFQDDAPYSTALKNTVTRGLVDTFGSDVLKVATRDIGDDQVAEAIMNRAQWGLDLPYIRAGKGTPLLEEMGISGAGQTVTVIDAAGQDHMAHTSYLASPERSGSRLLSYGCTEMSGPKSVKQVEDALSQAQALGTNVVSMSIGLGWDGEDKREYIEAAGGDEAKGRKLYDKDVAELGRAMDRFPGVIVVAAGNGGPGSVVNDLAHSSKVLVAGALDRSEAHAAEFTSPANHPENVLGVGTTVFAPAQDGQMRFLENATSWAAPQIAHFAACVYEAGEQFDQSVSAQEVRDILKKTAEPLAGQPFPRADVVTAVRYAKALAYVKSTGDAAMLRDLQGLSPARAREVASQVEPMLHDLGPDSREKISALIHG